VPGIKEKLMNILEQNTNKVKGLFLDKIIFSVDRGGEQGYQSKIRMRSAIEDLMNAQGIGYRKVVGAYKDERETAYVVDYDDENTEWVRSIAVAFLQESILMILPNGGGWLQFTDPNEPDMFLGFLKQIPVEEEPEAFFYDTSTNTKWRCG
jgi:hypothetical protein